MKSVLITLANAFLFVVIVAASIGLLLIAMWQGLGLDNTPQNGWIGVGALLAAMALLSILWWRWPGSWRINSYPSPRRMGTFGVGNYYQREPGGAPESPINQPHKFPDGDY